MPRVVGAIVVALACIASFTPAGRVLAVGTPGKIGDAEVHFVNDDDIIHFDEDDESLGQGQFYLSPESQIVELEIDLIEEGEDARVDDEFTLTMQNGTFSGSYASTVTDGNINDDACTTSWTLSEAGRKLVGDLACVGVGLNSRTTVPFAVTLPEEGAARLEVETDTETFYVYFFGAKAGDTIYVGGGTVASGAADCSELGGPDFSSDDSGHGSFPLALRAALMSVDDDFDTVVICDGSYEYSQDIGEYDGDRFYDSITLRAETSGRVTLNGGTSFNLDDPYGDEAISGFQLLDVQNASLIVSGINFVGGFALEGIGDGPEFLAGGGAIRVISGSLSITDSAVQGSAGYIGGGILVVGGTLEMNRVNATGNLAIGGGAVGVVYGSTIIRNSRLEDNWGLEIGGGALVWAGAPATIERSVIDDNHTVGGGAGVVAIGVDLEVTSSRFVGNRCEQEVFDIPSDGECQGAAVSVLPYAGLFEPHNPRINITGTSFSGNVSTGSGGAIYIENGVSVSLLNNTFTANHAVEQGGAVRIDHGNRYTSIQANTFSRNSAAQGGALSINDGFGEEGAASDAYRWQIASNTFNLNTATDSGGALHMAFDNSGNVSPNNVRSNRFVRNSAPGGGAIVVESDFGSERTILRRFERALRSNRFTANRAQDRRAVNIGVHFDE